MAKKSLKFKKAKRPMSTKNKVKRVAENIIMACLVIIMIYSALRIFGIIHGYDKNQNVYDKISEQSRDGKFTGDIDFDMLRQINPDIVGWIYYEDTYIDYPIVQGTDNDKYLNTMFDGSYGNFGTLFVDAETEHAFKQFNTIVYGHHMKNGSMFAGLKELKDPNYCAKHPRLELITPEGKFHLQIKAFLNQPSDSQIYVTNIHNLDERRDYLDMVERLANYTTNVSVSEKDRLVVLSTCAYEYNEARYMVICKMTPWKGQNIDMSYDDDSSESENADEVSAEGEELTEGYQ